MIIKKKPWQKKYIYFNHAQMFRVRRKQAHDTRLWVLQNQIEATGQCTRHQRPDKHHLRFGV